MIDEFDSNCKSEIEEIDDFEFGYDENVSEKEIERRCKEESEKEYFEDHNCEPIVSNIIIDVKHKNEIYKIWTTKLIKPLLIKFLKERCQDSIIAPELNKIDFTVIYRNTHEIIPIELQKTSLVKSSGGGMNFSHTDFQQSIRKQIDEVIRDYDKCWFFFDSEYLRYLQSGNIGKNASFDLTWLISHIENGKLKVFEIRYDGFVKELTIKDFDFLKLPEDEIILNKNKLKIYRNVLLGYNFTQEEIDNFYREFENRYDKSIATSADFCIDSSNDRCKLLGQIKYSLGKLNGINKCLDMNTINPNDKLSAIYIKIFEFIETHSHGNRGYNIKLVDKFDICKYFPGYMRQEKHWLTYKGNEMDGRTFSNMCRGFYRNAKTMFDF